MKIRFSLNAGNFLASWECISVSKRNFLPRDILLVILLKEKYSIKFYFFSAYKIDCGFLSVSSKVKLRKWIFLAMKYTPLLVSASRTRPLKLHKTGRTRTARENRKERSLILKAFFHQVRIEAECCRDKVFQLVCCRLKNITIPAEIVSWVHKRRYLIPYPSRCAIIQLKGTAPSQAACVNSRADLKSPSSRALQCLFCS